MSTHPTPPQPNGAWAWLDRLLGSALLVALGMVVASAWPGLALASGRHVGSGEPASELRSPADFNAVVSHSFKVVLRSGSPARVEVLADRNLLPLLETVVEDGRSLVLRWQRNTSIKPRVEPTITITVPPLQLQALVVAGSGNVHGESLQVGTLQARVTGSGDIRFSGLVADQLRLDVAGSGDVVASGRTSKLVVSIAGSGEVRTTELLADDVEVSIAGSGDAEVQAQRTLSAKIAGSGNVVYAGDAQVSSKVAGSGSVKRR